MTIAHRSQYFHGIRTRNCVLEFSPDWSTSAALQRDCYVGIRDAHPRLVPIVASNQPITNTDSSDNGAFPIPCYYNRENNREFRKIRTSNTIFVSDQRADSTAYSQIPYAKEQGIFKYVSGNFFRGTGKFNQAAEEQEISIGIARSGVTKRSRRCEQDRRAPLVDRPLQVFGGDAADDPRPDTEAPLWRLQAGTSLRRLTLS